VRPGRPDAVSFAIAALPLLAAFVALYVVAIRPWEAAVVRAANIALTAASASVRLEVDPTGRVTTIVPGPRGAWSPLSTTSRVHGVYLSAVLLPVLLLATPAPWGVRARWLVLAAPALFGLQVLALVAMFGTHLSLVHERGNFVARVGYGLAVTSGQLGALALWALITWRFWLDRRPRRS
jgi:hypothetical protein